MHRNILTKIEEKIKSKDEILGVFYTGSTATGRFDDFSDIDVHLMSEESPKKVLDELVNWISKTWEVKFLNRSERGVEVFVTKDFIKLEFDVLRKEDVMPELKMRLVKIVKDRNDFLQNIKKKSARFKIEVSYRMAVRLFLEFRDSQLYTARHTARGWKWSAMGEANHHGEQLFYLLAKLKGRYQFGFREAEKFLTKEELELLHDTRCHSTDVNEIQRAMKSNWKFMRYVENYYTKKSGKKLRLNSPDGELLQYVEKTYDRAKMYPQNHPND